MANFTYLFGAGASANAIPVVNGLIDGLRRHREWILECQETTQSTEDAYLEALDEVIKAAENHASIDTYAKKLYLQQQSDKLNALKSVLSVYFLCEQATDSFDKRYDTFWASILNEGHNFPENIRIVSWNYDMQFENAFQAYLDPERLRTVSRYTDTPNWQQSFCILKLNDTAEFICGRESRLGRENTPALRRPYYYNDNELLKEAMKAFNESIDNEACVPGISFAWESINRTDRLQDPFLAGVNEHISKTNVLVVIGYSFPFFNREVDRRLLVNMEENLEKVYIQDKNPDDVGERLEAALPVGRDVQIVLRTSVDQFYLPNEL